MSTTSARARLGFVVPSVNTVIEDELRALLPGDVSYSCGRVTLGTGDTATQLAAFETTVPEEAGKLGDARVDAVVLACTSASIVRGPEYDAQLTREIAERAGAPAITATAASVLALTALDAHRILVLTPYEDRVHGLEVEYLRGLGFLVADGRLTTPPQHLGRVAPAEVAREVVTLVGEQAQRPDVVLVSCANARLFATIPHLEATLQLPVVSSNQAAAWAALNLVGISTRLLDWGILARHDPRWPERADLPPAEAVGAVGAVDAVSARGSG